jgi:hypothetical protein
VTPKYVGDTDPRWHNGQLCYPGTAQGYPVRLPPGASHVPLKDREFRNLPVEYDVKAQPFNTWDAASFQEYQALLDRLGNGQFILIQRTKPEYDSDNKGWRMYVEWAQPYGRVEVSAPGMTS